jgi:hypothetical protein
MPAPDPWTDAQRLESWAGEVRVNLIRLAALLGFYGYHLVNVYLVGDASAAGDFHKAVTALVLAWSAGALMVYFALKRRWLHPALPYGVVLWDTLMVTLLLALVGGPRGPWPSLYLLIIASAPPRLSLRLVYLATGAAVVAYVISLGCYAYFIVGYTEYYANPALQIPRPHEIVFGLALITAGLLAGQAVRQARRLVQGYPIAVKEPQE